MEAAPTTSEVQRQLGRMLTSSLFKSAPRLSPLLRHIVETTLAEAGAKDTSSLSEHQIGFAVFDNYSPDRSAVRTNATFLRARLEKYYADIGEEDPVRIEIPPGGYRAVFSYSPQSPAGVLCTRAWLQIRNFAPSEREHSSLALFRETIEADAGHAPAHAALAEAELREALYRRAVAPYDPLAAAEASAREALRLQPGIWRAHVALGAVYCCRYRWQEARASFDAALMVAPVQTRDHVFFQGFLFATGKKQEALTLARLKAEDDPGDLSAQLAFGFFLYAARETVKAEAFMGELTRRFPQSWLAHMLHAAVYLATDQAVEAVVSIEEAYTVLYAQSVHSEPLDNVFPGFYNLCRLKAGSAMSATALRMAAESVTNAAGSGFWTKLQLALGYMGLGDHEAALEFLGEAADDGDPLMVFASILPVFDSSRQDAAFAALLTRISAPE